MRHERVLAATIGIAILGFVALAFSVASSAAFAAADRALVDAAHSALSAPALRFFEAVTWLGNGAVLAVLCAFAGVVLVARGERVLAFGLVAAAGGNGLLGAVLKRSFARVRPPMADGALQQAHGWSFPSGHASGALVTFGFLAYVALCVLPRRLHAPCMLVAAGLVLLVGASRVFVNAHYASDVLAGFASGSAWLLACILVVGRVRGRAPEPGSPGGVGSSLCSTSRM